MNRFLRDGRAVALFIVPAFLIYLFTVLVPIVWSFSYSLYTGMPGLKFTFSGVYNYLHMWSDPGFLSSFWINAKYVLVVVAGQVGLGLAMALLFMFVVKRFKTTVRTLVFFPVVLPVVAVGQLFSKMFEITPNNGLVNSFLVMVGLSSWVQPRLGQGDTALAVLSFMDIWTATGFYAVIFYAALMDIPKDLLEAAAIDGVGRWRMLWSILLPLIKPITITCLIFSFTGTLKLFESSIALNGGGPGGATKSLSMYMYDNSFLYSQYGYGSAIAVFILVECIVVTIILNRLFQSRQA